MGERYDEKPERPEDVVNPAAADPSTLERVRAELERAQGAGDPERLAALESIYRTLEEEVEQTASAGR